jgi:hypothetical protein
MKVEVKKIFDINRTGNRKIVMKPWEKLLLEMLEVENNPVFTRIQVKSAHVQGNSEKCEPVLPPTAKKNKENRKLIARDSRN